MALKSPKIGGDLALVTKNGPSGPRFVRLYNVSAKRSAKIKSLVRPSNSRLRELSRFVKAPFAPLLLLEVLHHIGDGCAARISTACGECDAYARGRIP